MPMRIRVVAVGKIKEKYFSGAIEEYSKRLTRFCKLEIIEADDEKAPAGLADAQISQALEREGARVKPHLKNTVVISLDSKGQKVSSERFSEILRGYVGNGKALSFVIGGSLGISREILDLSDMRISMSDMTFPHQMARVMLLEQIYRAFKIIGNENYHK